LSKSVQLITQNGADFKRCLIDYLNVFVMVHVFLLRCLKAIRVCIGASCILVCLCICTTIHFLEYWPPKNKCKRVYGQC